MVEISEISFGSTENIAINVAPGHTHPFFLHASYSPGMNLVNSSFNGKGYGGWWRSILISLSAKNKVGFIDGTHNPPASNSTNIKLWRRCNDIVISWLLNSLSKKINLFKDNKGFMEGT